MQIIKKTLKKIWDDIRTILNTKKQKSFKQITLSINKIIVTNELEITDHFNSFFTSIANNLVDKIPPTQKSFSSYLFKTNENSFFLAPTTTEEIEDIIKNFKLNKAFGPNSIPIRILKDQKEEIAKPLHDLINTCFSLGLFLDLLKIAKIIPIFKNKGSPQDCSNYRPISLISNLSKIIEKLLYQCLYAFLNEHNCLYKHQFGFRNHHSTNHALISITEYDNGEFARGVFLDFQKAFDTVNHEMLLSKLEHYGIRGVPLNLLISYLKNRSQYTSINNFSSKTLPINHGVPQGSVLGPLLFLIYINDLVYAVQHSKVHHFADDTNILCTSKSLKDINKKVNHDLKNIVEWVRAYKISLNFSKTELILFRSKNKLINKKMNFRISGQKVEMVKKTKYLGIILDKNLSFKYNIENLRFKLNTANGLLAKIRHYVQAGLRRTLYFA